VGHLRRGAGVIPDGRSIGAGLVLTGLALAIWGFGDRNSNEVDAVDDPIRMVSLDMKSGNVRVETSDDSHTTIREHREYWVVKTGDAYHVEGDKLVLDGDCGWQCTADFVVTVPRGTRIEGESASGDVVLENVGDVDVEVASGNITARGAAAVTVDAASGDVVVDGANSAVDLESQSGDVKVGRLTGGPVSVKSASGDAVVDLDKADVGDRYIEEWRRGGARPERRLRGGHRHPVRRRTGPDHLRPGGAEQDHRDVEQRGRRGRQRLAVLSKLAGAWAGKQRLDLPP
jgi:hypothetical protein